MGNESKHFYEFGPFRLDATERVLLQDGHLISLPPKDLETLLVLVQESGHIVEKDELLEKVWPGTFVEEGNLARHVSNLRRALGDAADGQRYIATVPKRGYRFVAPVKEHHEAASDRDSKGGVVQEDATPRTLAQPPPEDVGGVRDRIPLEGATARRALASRGPVLGIIAAFVVLAGVAALQFWSRSHPQPRRAMLAVLPVQNMSGDPEQEYVCDGFTEEMISQLGRLNHEQLGVIARTSAMTYKTESKPVDRIARELRVDYVLESSLRRSGDRLRITVQLIRTSDQTHLWASEYDRTVSDVVALQGEVAQAIAREIEVRITPREKTQMANTPPVGAEAHLAYLKGRYFWNKRTDEGLKKAIVYFEDAISKDPKYALAYAGLADSHVLLGSDIYGAEPPGDGMLKAKEEAQKALELDDTISEGHTALAWVHWTYDWDWQAAEKEFRRAAELRPNDARAHHWYAIYLSAMGRREEANAEITRALEPDPLSLIVNTAAGTISYYARRYDQAAEHCQKAIEMDASFVRAHLWLALALEQKSAFEGALQELDKTTSISADSPRLLSAVGHVYAAWGKKKQAQEVLNNLNELAKRRYVSPYYRSVICAGLDEKDQALAELDKAYRERSSALVFLKVEPIFDNLRSDPRFADFMRRVGLPL